MLTLNVNMADAKARDALAAAAAALAPESCAVVAAEAGADVVRDHFTGLSRSRHRPGQRLNYYLQAADSVIREASGADALIRIPHTGIAQRFFGGTVYPSGRTSAVTGKPIRRLAIGLSGTPGEGHVPADFADLFCIPSEDGKAVLARTAGEAVQALFALVPKVVQPADPSVLPADADILDAAAEGILDLYEASQEKNT